MPSDALPSCSIKTSPEDFVVEELPAYEPSGEGEHLFVTFEKRGRTTPDAVGAIARALGVDPRTTGHAGMKDRHARTTQTASFQVPLARAGAEDAALALSLDGITVISARRHGNKLKPGHLLGNRFLLVLRELDDPGCSAVETALADAGRRGVPNAFGPQRFGRDGDNAERTLAWLAGRTAGPRNKEQARLLFSSLQAHLFNQVLARRVADGSWCSVVPGDIAKKHDTGGLFDVPLEGADLADAQARAVAGAISATGPIFGARMRWPGGAVAALEEEVLLAALGDRSRLEGTRHLGEGTRRSLRLEVGTVSTRRLPDGSGLEVGFVLPKGGYATTVLATACRPVDRSYAPRGANEGRGSGEGPDDSTEADNAPSP